MKTLTHAVEAYISTIAWEETDELARMAKQDPLTYRLALLKDPRAKAVVEGKPIPEGVQLMLDDITGGAAK